MNPSDEKIPSIDRELLDELVDGELAEPERRELLRRLEHTPGGWRACALAFLESQCLGESLGRQTLETAIRQPEVLARPASPRRRPRSDRLRHAGTALAMAASFVAALGIGWWARGGRHVGEEARMPSADSFASAPQEPAAVRQLQPLSPRSRSPVMTVALPAVGADGQQVRLPVVERDQLDQSILYPDAQGIPAQLREALRRAGYQVRQSHELLPVPVEDGRHAVVPVDQLDVHYVGNHVE